MVRLLGIYGVYGADNRGPTYLNISLTCLYFPVFSGLSTRGIVITGQVDVALVRINEVQ